MLAAITAVLMLQKEKAKIANLGINIDAGSNWKKNRKKYI